MDSDLSAEDARELTGLSAAQAAQLTQEAVAQAAQAQINTLQALEDHIADITTEQVGRLNAEIHAATGRSESRAHMLYEERISASRNSRELVEFIEEIANIVSHRIYIYFKEKGYRVATQPHENLDYRQNRNEAPEYYDTDILISW